LKRLLFRPSDMRRNRSPRFRLSLRTLLAFLLLAPVPLQGTARAAPAKPIVVAYVFPRASILSADQISAKRLTRINFAFANIEDGRIVEGTPNDTQNLAVLNGLKRDNPSLTLLVSVGGWLWSGRFSDMARTPVSRSEFIDSVVAFITRHRLDGLDIDWEYPGQVGAGNVFRPEDKQNYTLLIRDLRARFRREEKVLHRRLYITVATGASSEFLEHTEMRKVQRYVDSVNLMSYDYYEPGDDKITGNHAPLYSDPTDPKGVSADRSVHEFQKAGVPTRKLVLGVPFYGHVWGEVPPTNDGLFQPGKPVPNAHARYSELTSTMLGHGFARYWDAAASVPYLYNPESRTFVTYEDPESLSLKCRYILRHHLAGIMFWEYTNDPSGALLGTIYNQLRTEAPQGGGQ
jgi:chitinase